MSRLHLPSARRSVVAELHEIVVRIAHVDRRAGPPRTAPLGRTRLYRDRSVGAESFEVDRRDDETKVIQVHALRRSLEEVDNGGLAYSRRRERGLAGSPFLDVHLPEPERAAIEVKRSLDI